MTKSKKKASDANVNTEALGLTEGTKVPNGEQNSMSTVVDISALGNLAPTQPIDLSVIPEQPKKSFSFPRAGVYTVIAPEIIPAEAFSKSQSNSLKARVDPKVVGPTNSDYEVRFTNISAKEYVDSRTNLTTSQVAQYLQAFGIKDTLPEDPAEVANLIASTAGKEAKVYLNWEVEHRPSGFKLRGMKNFPSDNQGGFLNYIEHPDPEIKDAQGNRLRLRANVVVSKWLPKTDEV